MNYEIIKGNLITLSFGGHFDVIGHGCNCLSKMKSGLAPQMVKTFGCDTFRMEKWGPTIEKLGNIDFETFILGKNDLKNLKNTDNILGEPELTVCNIYSQYKYGYNHKYNMMKPLDYEALTICLRKLNNIFQGSVIGLPMIGAGLAGGNWDKIFNIIKNELNKCYVIIVEFDGSSTPSYSDFCLSSSFF